MLFLLIHTLTPLASDSTLGGIHEWNTRAASTAPAPPALFECAMRKLSAQFATELIPASTQIAFDALELGSLCGEPSPAPLSAAELDALYPRPRRVPAAAEFHVHPRFGRDGRSGRAEDPLQTISHAVARCRSAEGERCDVLLTNGETFHLESTVHLGTADSHTHITAATPFAPLDPRATPPVMSGGVDITADLKWSAAPSSVFPAGVLMSTIPATSAAAALNFTQLFVDSERVVRARHPNANPGGYYTTGLWVVNASATGWFSRAKGWVPGEDKNASRTVFQTIRNTTKYANFTLGFDGPVSEFVPPAAYWAVENPPAGGGCKYTVPQAVIFDDSSFTSSGARTPPSKWSATGAVGAVVHAFHFAHWGDWSFEVDALTMSASNAGEGQMHFKRGGFQEARGSCGRGGHDWYVENVKELLDAKTEWFLDTKSTPHVLYYYPNTTTTSLSSDDVKIAASLAHVESSIFIASKLATLVNISGDAWGPIVGSKLSSVTLSHSATTFMGAYEVPSAGDWSIHRGGAVLIENAEKSVIDGCKFDQVGGNGVTVSKYARDIVISNNEIVRIGDSGILVVGDLKYETATPWDHSVDGAYPLNTTVSGNLIHELGLFTKQTAGFFQALAANTSVIGNIVLNGPRSALNFNDAAFGGNDISRNLLANVVRETTDHGPWNSWDRNPYIWRADLTDIGENAATTSEPRYSSIHHNFIFCSYGGIKGVDHDDGSGWYHDHDNFLPYCTGKMKGETQTLRRSVFLFPRWTSCFKSMGGMAKDPPQPMVWEENTCVNLNPDIYSTCSSDQSRQILANNTLFVQGAYTDAKTGATMIPGFPCNDGNFTAYQQLGPTQGQPVQDAGTTVSGKIPTVETMVGWGKKLLDMK